MSLLLNTADTRLLLNTADTRRACCRAETLSKRGSRDTGLKGIAVTQVSKACDYMIVNEGELKLNERCFGVFVIACSRDILQSTGYALTDNSLLVGAIMIQCLTTLLV